MNNNKDNKEPPKEEKEEERNISYSHSSVGMRTRLLTYNIKIDRCVYTLSRKEKMNTACSVVMMNLLACLKNSHTLVYSRNTKVSKRTNKWNKKHNRNNLSVYKMAKAVEVLIEKGYVTEVRGIAHAQEEGRVISEIHPTEKFLLTFHKQEQQEKADIAYSAAQPVLMLRDENTKSELEYEMNEETDRMEDVVRQINLINKEYTFTTYDGEVLDNSKAMRIFTGDMHKGGRYYHNDVLKIRQRSFVDGKIILKPVEETRLGMLIDGESVVEVDFCCLHPMLLLDIEGEDKDILKGDVYSAMLSTQQATNPANRHLMKMSVNYMLNADSGIQAQRAIQGEMNKGRGSYDLHSATQVMATIKGTLLPIAHHFCSSECTGMWLQYLDSKIMEKVFLKFIEMKKPVVSVHDSALVRRQDAQVLVDSMASSYRSVIGEEIGDEEAPEDVNVFMKMSLPDGSCVRIEA